MLARVGTATEQAVGTAGVARREAIQLRVHEVVGQQAHCRQRSVFAHAGQPGQPQVGSGVFKATFGRQRQFDAACKVALQRGTAELEVGEGSGTVETWPGSMKGTGHIREAEIMQELGVHPAEQVQVLALQRAQGLDPFEQAGAVGALHGLVQHRLDLRAEQLAKRERVDQPSTVIALEQLEDEERVAPLAGIARAEQATQ